MLLLSLWSATGCQVRAVIWHLLCYQVSWSQVGNRTGVGLYVWSFIFSLVKKGSWLISATTPLHNISPLSLGSATMCTHHSGWNADFAPLALWPGEGCNLTLHCYPISWGPQPALNYICTPISVLPLSVSPAHFDMLIFRFLNALISHIFVCWAGHPFLNYSCPTCNFRGWTKKSSYSTMMLTSLKHYPL